MFCSNCGTELPTDAAFCWKCGKPTKPGTRAEEPKGETCEIVYEEIYHVWYPEHKFWAQAIGANGRYSAGEIVFKNNSWNVLSDDRKTVAALDSLINKLVQEGWESTGDRGRNWFNHRFRRRVK